MSYPSALCLCPAPCSAFLCGTRVSSGGDRASCMLLGKVLASNHSRVSPASLPCAPACQSAGPRVQRILIGRAWPRGPPTWARESQLPPDLRLSIPGAPRLQSPSPSLIIGHPTPHSHHCLRCFPNSLIEKLTSGHCFFLPISVRSLPPMV